MTDLTPLPDADAIVAKVREIIREQRGREPRPTANQLARALGVRGARRSGNGAVKGSWSGTMSPSLRIAPRLAALTRAGRLAQTYDRENYRYVYHVPGEEWWK